MSEADDAKKTALAQAGEEAMVVDTMGGRVHVRWDETAQATPHGQRGGPACLNTTQG